MITEQTRMWLCMVWKHPLVTSNLSIAIRPKPEFVINNLNTSSKLTAKESRILGHHFSLEVVLLIYAVARCSQSVDASQSHELS